MAPFFVTYLIRTLAWLNILADEGPVVGFLQGIHLLGDDGRLLATTTAVVAGITYNFLPFMALPLYVSLEQIDPRMLEAAKDLYSSSTQTFLRVTLPLSAPGIVAGTLLTFIPAAGDFINAALLGTPKQQMIGNVIQAKFLAVARLSDGGLAVLHPHGDDLVGLLVYARGGVGEAHRMSALGLREAACADGVRPPRCRLSDAADRRRHPLLVQRSSGPLQLRLGRVHFDNWIGVGRRARHPGRGDPSLEVGLLATLVATVLGTLIAFAIVRQRFAGRGTTNLLVFLPMATPEIVLGASLSRCSSTRPLSSNSASGRSSSPT